MRAPACLRSHITATWTTCGERRDPAGDQTAAWLETKLLVLVCNFLLLMGPEVISAAISTAVPIFLKLVRGAAGRFDYGTSDPVLRAIVEAVYPNSNGRSRYRYRRSSTRPQKMRDRISHWRSPSVSFATQSPSAVRRGAGTGGTGGWRGTGGGMGRYCGRVSHSGDKDTRSGE